ncbi:MAG TPA: DJ-1/PfpI family protein [Clostridia bacterium]|nr:DJ-1/PfpI family protein [Clostridia bacterium]
MKFNVILFNGFETLDAFGPVEVIGLLGKFYQLGYYSEKGGIVRSIQGIGVETLPMSDIEKDGIIMIPGGFGARTEVNNAEFIEGIKELAENSRFVLTVCTGSALLAKTGLLKNRRATSNKMSFEWAASQDPEVKWVRRARWTQDGKYYTSSGISAGIDMALGFVSDMISPEAAEKVACGIEYIWNRDRDSDPFCKA